MPLDVFMIVWWLITGQYGISSCFGKPMSCSDISFGHGLLHNFYHYVVVSLIVIMWKLSPQVNGSLIWWFMWLSLEFTIPREVVGQIKKHSEGILSRPLLFDKSNNLSRVSNPSNPMHPSLWYCMACSLANVSSWIKAVLFVSDKCYSAGLKPHNLVHIYLQFAVLLTLHWQNWMQLHGQVIARWCVIKNLSSIERLCDTRERRQKNLYI